MKKASEFQDLAFEELQAQLKEARAELFEMRNQIGATKKVEKPHLIGQKRKEIARMLTVMRQKQVKATGQS
jgi:large subunit ribosomal protein L29